MAYCPLAQAGRLRDGLFQHTDIKNMANARGVTAAQLLLAWVIRHPGVLAIPKAASIEHVVQNAAALDIVLSPKSLRSWIASIRRRRGKPGWIWFNPQRIGGEEKKPRDKRGFCVSVFSR
jgi:diketogulonate reductase-like aldo/keto reductase